MGGERIKEAFGRGKPGKRTLMVGQSIGLIKKVLTCRELLDTMVQEAIPAWPRQNRWLPEPKSTKLFIRRLRREINTTNRNSYALLKAQISFPRRWYLSLTLHPCSSAPHSNFYSEFRIRHSAFRRFSARSSDNSGTPVRPAGCTGDNSEVP